MDAVGVLPTEAETKAFVNDNSENAYEKLVDRLLAMAQYGEKWRLAGSILHAMQIAMVIKTIIIEASGHGEIG